MTLFQMLIYPVFDSRLQTNSMRRFTDTPIWNARLNTKIWELYLPHNKRAMKDPYASPNEAVSFTGLPKWYIEVSEFDCLRGEAIEYSHKLERNGIQTILRHVQRAPGG